jgi:hypothetical protein
MEIIKRKVSLEEATSRENEINFGTLKVPYFYFKVPLKQNIDDMGVFTDYSFTPTNLITQNLSQEEKQLRLSGTVNDNWFYNSGKLSGFTDSKLEYLRTYSPINPYIVNFDVETNTYTNFSGTTINGVSRVTNISGDSITYVYDTNNDSLIGTNNQNSGLLYQESLTNLIDGSTKLKFNSEGWNDTNTSLSAIIKEDYLMGIISPPEIDNSIFIDRGNISVFENHFKLSEIESLDHLVRYGNGFYNIMNNA